MNISLYFRVANVLHSHVIWTIRNTYIFSKQPSTQVEKLICVSRMHYRRKTVQRSYPSLVSSFICMFHLFMKFRHLRVYSCQPCFFRAYRTHIRPSASQNMTKLNKRGLRKQWKWSEFSPKRQSCLFGSRNVIIIPFTAVTNNDRKPNTGHTTMSGVTGHTRLFWCSSHMFQV